MNISNKIKIFNSGDYSMFSEGLINSIKSLDNMTFEIIEDNSRIDLFLYSNQEQAVHVYVFDDEKILEVGYIDVAEAYQRQGLGTLVFNLLEELFNKTLKNYDKTTPSGAEFWKNYQK